MRPAIQYLYYIRDRRDPRRQAVRDRLDALPDRRRPRRRAQARGRPRLQAAGNRRTRWRQHRGR